MRRQNTVLEADQKKPKQKKPFVSFMCGGMAIILIGCAAFSMLLYKSNMLMTVDDANTAVANSSYYKQINVQTIKSKIEQGDFDDSNSPSGNNSLPIPGMTEWYSDLSKFSVGTVIQGADINCGSGSVQLYKGLPWAPVDGAYFYYSYKATQDLVKYVDAKCGGETGISPTSVFVYGGSNQVVYPNVQGVSCISVALPPCVIDKTFCDSFKSNTWLRSSCPPADAYGYANKVANPRRYCVVMKTKDSTYEAPDYAFMPCVVTCAKGHTFPGGVMQTHLRIDGNPGGTDDGPFKLQYGDHGKNDLITWQQLKADLDVSVSSSENSPLRAYWKNNLEIWGGNETITNQLNKAYDIVGFIAWPL